MNNQEIEKLALSSGFNLKKQPSGEMGLNPYVYGFARELLSNAIPEGYALVSIEHIEQAASDNNNRSVSWRKSTIRLFGKILKIIEASKAEK